MHDDIKEARRLKHLLTTERLSYSERVAIEQQIRELEKPRTETSACPRSPGVFGMFDRPHPGASEPEPSETNADEPKGKSSPTPQVELPPITKEPAGPDLSPEEAEDLAERIAAIADRIVWLRSVWARTLSLEIDRESEAWLAKLQELSKKLPEELLEVTLGDRIHLVRQQVRVVAKPVISEKVQQQLIAPSAPSLDPVGTLSEIYFAIHQAPPQRRPQHPPGYVPDGLQALVA